MANSKTKLVFQSKKFFFVYILIFIQKFILNLDKILNFKFKKMPFHKFEN
jgi:uncharacterized membrane protein